MVDVKHLAVIRGRQAVGHVMGEPLVAEEARSESGIVVERENVHGRLRLLRGATAAILATSWLYSSSISVIARLSFAFMCTQASLKQSLTSMPRRRA